MINLLEQYEDELHNGLHLEYFDYHQCFQGFLEKFFDKVFTFPYFHLSNNLIKNILYQLYILFNIISIYNFTNKKLKYN